MWQLHGQLQSHPFSPKGRSHSLSPPLYLTPLYPPDRSAPPPGQHTRHWGLSFSNRLPVLFKSSRLHCPVRMFGILLTSNFNMRRSLYLRLPAFFCSYRWGTASWLVSTCMCWAALEAFVAESSVSLTVRSVDGLNVQIVCPIYLMCVRGEPQEKHRGKQIAGGIFAVVLFSRAATCYMSCINVSFRTLKLRKTIIKNHVVDISGIGFNLLVYFSVCIFQSVCSHCSIPLSHRSPPHSFSHHMLDLLHNQPESCRCNKTQREHSTLF